MGTNYYVKTDTCPSCGHKPEGIHLGKSSHGWKFAFRLNGEYYKNIRQLRKWLKDKKIENEYGEEVEANVFWNMVKSKQKITDPSDDDISVIIDGYKFIDREFS